MSEGLRHDRLIEGLVAGLEPRRPLRAPLLRALGWSALVLLIAAILAAWTDRASLAARMAVTDQSMAWIGSALTAFAAALAAFLTSVPGRSVRWALLPLAPAALWLGASGLGCLRGWVLPVADPAGPHEMEGCLAFILALSLPLSVVLVAMLRRACALRPNLTAALAGLAAASGAASLLVLVHPHDATWSDLAAHMVAVGAVIGANSLLGGRLLEARPA